jgi:elongation factor 1-beta
MAKVVASFRILPTGTEIKLDTLREAIKKALPQEVYIHGFDEEPIAFGLVALIAHIVMPEDVGGEMEKIEQTLCSVNGVGQIDVIMVRRA